MSKNNRPPAGQPWMWETLEMKESDALWSLSGGARRFIDMLVIEHMRSGGRRNGLLLLPHRQCGRVGHSGLIAQYIANAEEVGFIDCFRGGMRVATKYALTWLPLHDGTPATNRWRGYRNPNLPPWPDINKRNKREKKHD